MKNYIKLILLLLLLVVAGASLSAHPFDQVRNDSSSRFTIDKKKINFEVKFPVHSYVNLWVKTRNEFDIYSRNILASIEKSKIKNYIYKHFYAFNGKVKLETKVQSLLFTHSEFSIRDEPEFIIVRGSFLASSKIIDIYIFNDLFIESNKPHFGDAEIEYKDKVFDFQFRKRKYFHLNLERY